jgi:hypothetical protein
MWTFCFDIDLDIEALRAAPARLEKLKRYNCELMRKQGAI